ncbi:nucleoside kinase [Paludibacter sp. 221]|uniref:nucleoside kinase n=1 Tax=Paludibacter sp. 221 TaxID=2302939 RepID=UPI0013D0C59C|nr:nucleoside kinase [Paludibacter sp. 221]NDV47316.1 nucleoside kinase [Paludibacter sp. 221]
MEKKVTIFCKNTGSYHDYPIGTSLIEIYEDLHIELSCQVVAARVNYKVEDLNFLVYKPKDIEFLDLTSPSGMRVYVRTLSMVLAKAISELFPQAVLRIEHPISKGYYCTLENLGQPLTAEVVEKIKDRIGVIISQKKRIYSEEKQIEEVKRLFAQANQEDKISLFETLGTPYARYFRIDDFIDYYVGVLMPSTDYLYLFDLMAYYDGFLLRVPNRENPKVLEEVVTQPKMYGIFKEYVGWNKIMGINNIGAFNLLARKRESINLIKISEALHEKKVASIADMISSREQTPRFVLVSGPSSSGKTTFSKRLSVQLMVSKLKPVALSLDNYFVDRELTPKDENGNWDFEHFEALDIDLFNQNLKYLLSGEEVEIPMFNFETGKRQYKGEKLKLEDDNILIIEGIHALNPKLIQDIPLELTFKIYVSALTTISIDNHNWIPTTDTRLLRRIIRDYKYRNYSARDTISRWDSVRRGEDKWIFPYQENADVMFNSALLFELAVLKHHAEPILLEVPKYCNEYTEAHRLLKFLNYFVSIPDREIPPTSLLREFVGGSSFRY